MGIRGMATDEGEREPLLPPGSELTSDGIWRLVEQRVQQEMARAVKDAEIRGRRQQLQQMRRPIRRPRRGERTEFVGELASQGAAMVAAKASKAQMLKPLAWRFGKSVAEAGLAAHDAGNLMRGASVTNACGSSCAVAISPEVEANRRARVVQAASTISSGLIRNLPKGLVSRVKRQ